MSGLSTSQDPKEGPLYMRSYTDEGGRIGCGDLNLKKARNV